MKKIYFLFILFMVAAVNASHASTRVPHKVHFQSVFYDNGGNPLPSGSYIAQFRVLNQSEEALYTEEQGIELANGVVSVMIGDGYAAGSNLSQPTGGIPTGALEPNQPLFLEVTVNGEIHASSLEIGSVPFAYYSEEALSVAPGAVVADSISQGVIDRSHLSQALQEAIFGSIAPERLGESAVSEVDLSHHVNSANAHPATAIYITQPAFAHSRSNNVADVLKDLDRAIETDNLYTGTKVSKAGDTMSGNLDMGGHTVTNLALPTNPNDASTKAYIDQQYNSLNTQVSASISSANISANALQGQVNALESAVASMPKVVSWGVVYLDLHASLPPDVRGKYNVANVEKIFDPDGLAAYQITFLQPISFPYVVVANAVQDWRDGDRDDMVTIVQDHQQENGFVLRTVNGASGGGPTLGNISFNFAVIK